MLVLVLILFWSILNDCDEEVKFKTASPDGGSIVILLPVVVISPAKVALSLVSNCKGVVESVSFLIANPVLLEPCVPTIIE